MNVSSRRRLVLVYVLAAAMLVSLGGLVIYLQVMNNSSFTKLAEQNQTRSVIVPAVRGEIVDDNGTPLVSNRSALVVSVNMSLVSQQPGGGTAELARLARLLHMSDKTLNGKVRLCPVGVPQPCWPGSPYQPIPVDQHVTDRVAVQVLEDKSQFRGVTAQVQPVVQYGGPDATDAAQELGYLQPITAQEVKQLGIPVTGFSGEDLVGQAGLEEQYDKQLRGRSGADEVTVNADGQVTGTLRRISPESGDDLVTSINAELQEAVESDAWPPRSAESQRGQPRANQAAAVVMTTTGG